MRECCMITVVTILMLGLQCWLLRDSVVSQPHSVTESRELLPPGSIQWRALAFKQSLPPPALPSSQPRQPSKGRKALGLGSAPWPLNFPQQQSFKGSEPASGSAMSHCHHHPCLTVRPLHRSHCQASQKYNPSLMLAEGDLTSQILAKY